MKTRPPLLALLAVAHLLASTTLATERDTEGAPALENRGFVVKVTKLVRF